MGLCCSKTSVYLCRMKNIEDLNRFRSLCDIYDIEVKTIEGCHITVEADEQQIESLRKYCYSVYNVSESEQDYAKLI